MKASENPLRIGNRGMCSTNLLFYIVDWLPPDFGAVGQYGAIYARELAVAGRDVRLIGLTTGDHSTTRELLANGKVFETTQIHSANYIKSGFIARLLWTFRTNMRIVYEVARDSGHHKQILSSRAPRPSCYYLSYSQK